MTHPSERRPPGAVPPDVVSGEYGTPPGVWLVVAVFVVAPMVALLDEGIAYVVVPWACHRDAAAWVRLVPPLSLIALLAIAVAAWLDWRSTGGGTETDGGTVADRRRFVALAGLGLTALSAVAVAWQWIATWMVHPCLHT